MCSSLHIQDATSVFPFTIVSVTEIVHKTLMIGLGDSKILKSKVLEMTRAF